MGLVGSLAFKIKCTNCSWWKGNIDLIMKLSLVSIEDCKFNTVTYEKSIVNKEKQTELKFESYYE